MPSFPHRLAYTGARRGGSTELSQPRDHYSGETASVKEVVAQGVLDCQCSDIRQSPAGEPAAIDAANFTTLRRQAREALRSPQRLQFRNWPTSCHRNGPIFRTR